MPLNSNRSALSLAFPFFIGAIIGVFFLYYFSTALDPNVKFEEFALGGENTSSLGLVNDIQVHCYDLEDAHKCINGYKKSRPREDIILWLGNSQLHTINQMKQGNLTAAHILHQYANVDSKYYLTFSQPNASLQEHYLLFEYLTHKLPVTTLVLPVVFDDMRETGIRSSLIDAFKNQTTSRRLNKTEIGRKMDSNQGDQDSSGNDMAALEDTVQEQSEKYLNDELEEIWNIWEKRPELRGSFLGNLYLFRNWLFRINPSSIRKMIPGRYIMNMQALKAILQSANEQKIKVLIYIPPLRDDVKIPYDLEQYSNFKAEVQSIVKEYGVRFSNLENLVPAKYWGTKDTTTLGGGQELDFMHFQAGGHRLLADALYEELKDLRAKRNIHDF